MTLLPLYNKEKHQVYLDEIIRQCRSGSARAQNRLFNMFYSDGFHVASRYSSCEDDAKEILSNAFIRAFKKLDHYDTKKPFFPWFKKLILHASSDYYRYHKEQHIGLDFINQPETPSEEMIDELSYKDLLGLIQKLPYSYRSVFNLFVIEGYKHQEIGELLGISEGTSKSHLSRARQRLQLMIRQISKLERSAFIRQENKQEAK